MNYAELAGRLFGTYFLLYPVIYFVWNWFVVQVNYAAYQIPGFWIGMAGFLILNVARNLIFGVRK